MRMNAKSKLLVALCLSALTSSCTGPDYQTTAQLISSLGQSAASVLSAQYQATAYGGSSSNYGGSSYGGYDYGRQMPSQQGYAADYGGGYCPTQPYCPPQQPMPCYYPVYY